MDFSSFSPWLDNIPFQWKGLQEHGRSIHIQKGDHITDKEVGSVTGEQKETNKEEVQDENEKNELNQEIADTENIKATLVSIEKFPRMEK